MTARLPDDGKTGDTTRALDEFTTEQSDLTAEPRQEGARVFACDADPRSEMAVGGGLLDLAPAPAPHAEQRPLSRVESLKARRAKRRAKRLRRFASVGVLLREWVARMGAATLRGASRSGAATRAVGDSVTDASISSVRRGRRAIRRTSLRLASRALDATRTIASAARAWKADGARAMAMPSMGTAFEHQQASGFVVAVLVAVSVVGYGGLLTMSWRQPIEPSTPAHALNPRPQFDGSAAPATPAPSGVPVPTAASAALVRVVQPSAVLPVDAAPVVRRAAFWPSPRTLTAMWRERDTRSLDQAFSTLRRQTLAFHRCAMRMTDTNRAVARCDGIATATGSGGTESVRRATWTLAFARSAGRWQMTDVTMR